ncbi:hypothetical protein OLV17_15470, partial [Klebsiella pneumoniae]|uniref:hypothetical protein n=1 Tax=Klebsiella pneumoniae TaxID=573 RepID=UPI00384F4F51
WLMMSLWDALRMNMMISYQELVRTFPIKTSLQNEIGIKEALANCSLEERVVELDMASDEKGRRLPGKRC